MSVWINGAWRGDGAKVALNDRGLLLGDGLFETLLIRGGRPVFFAEHMARLRAGAAALGLPVPYKNIEIREVLLSLDSDRVGDDRLFSARITLTRGPGPRGIVPPVAEEARPVMAISGAAAAAPADTPVTCHVAETRRNEGSPAARMKTLSYMDNIIARQEAAAAGADDAIMLNNKGQVACASVANIFVIRDGALLTPALDCGVLPGIVRNRLLSLAAAAGAGIEEGLVFADDLAAHPFFLTNSLIGLRPAMLAGQDAPAMPALFETLKRAYDEAVAADAAEPGGS